MKRSSVAYTAVVLIVLIGLSLFLRIWASARAVSIMGPSAMHIGRDGTVYIMSNDFLYLHDREGSFLDKIPMSKFGINHVIGDFWVYANGDLLLRREVAQTLTLSGEAELFARTGAGENDRLGTGESILQRCSIRTFQCRNFGEGREVFDKITAFSLMVDEEKGITYLSDTVGHQLLMLDDSGKIIQRSNTPFQFPNQLVLEDDGLLYVADTNNHRVAAVRTAKDTFGTVEKEFKIVHPRGPRIRTWPMSLTQAADKRWWIINAGENMSYGIVMVLSEKGVYEKFIVLPRGADPLRLAAAGDRVLITDPALMRVYSAGQNGELLDDFGSLLFKLDLLRLSSERRRYEAIATASMWALIILLFAALLLARQARFQEARAKGAGQPAFVGDPSRFAGPRRYDYHSFVGTYRIKFAIITVLLLVAIFFQFLISRGLTLFHKEFFPAALLAHFVISFFMYLHLKRSFIEIDERGITYQGMSRNIVSPWNGVRKISVYGNSTKIVTDHGNFSVGAIEPADSPPGGWLELFRRQRLKYHKELVEVIRKHAPHAKVNISWLVRFQWNRL